MAQSEIEKLLIQLETIDWILTIVPNLSSIDAAVEYLKRVEKNKINRLSELYEIKDKK